MKALDLFRTGMDTAEIAARLSREYGREVPEYLIYNDLHRTRSAEKGLAVQFERHARRGVA